MKNNCNGFGDDMGLGKAMHMTSTLIVLEEISISNIKFSEPLKDN
jgi:hypothetical protein